MAEQHAAIACDMETFAVRGQYEQGWLAGERVKGYRQEEGVSAKSTPRVSERG